MTTDEMDIVGVERFLRGRWVQMEGAAQGGKSIWS